MHAERAEERKEFEKRSFLTLLPARCRQMIDNATCLESDDLEGFWDQVQQIVQREDGHSPADNRYPEQLPDDLVNALTGVAAVFILLHREWLAAHPERKDWCLNQLRDAVLNPPALNYMDSPESAAAWTWDCFAAESLPILWAEEPDNEELRCLIARLVFAPHHVAVRILFQRCAEHRVTLGGDFDILRRLLFEWAHMMNRISFVRYARQYSESLTDDESKCFAENVDAWARDRLSKFVRRELLQL